MKTFGALPTRCRGQTCDATPLAWTDLAGRNKHLGSFFSTFNCRRRSRHTVTWALWRRSLYRSFFVAAEVVVKTLRFWTAWTCAASVANMPCSMLLCQSQQTKLRIKRDPSKKSQSFMHMPCCHLGTKMVLLMFFTKEKCPLRGCTAVFMGEMI